MKAIVKEIDYQKALVVFETEDFDCGWGEMYIEAGSTYGDLEEDDEIIGIFDNYGITEITIEKNGIAIDIFIEDFGLSYEDALEKIPK